eukprot:393698-Rhodomonas_salina.1
MWGLLPRTGSSSQRSTVRVLLAQLSDRSSYRKHMPIEERTCLPAAVKQSISPSSISLAGIGRCCTRGNAELEAVGAAAAAAAAAADAALQTAPARAKPPCYRPSIEEHI